MTTLPLAVTTRQGPLLIPEVFQSGLINGMTAKMLIPDCPPCLLRAPTGSGKTYVLCQVLDNIQQERDTLWFWFVPYVNLISQTMTALTNNAAGLSPVLFTDGLNQTPAAGQVLISTTQGVSRAAWREVNYHAGGSELARTPAEFAALARAEGLQIGVVVDEAHIALDEATEFGQFIKWLQPSYLALATATPNSERINQFLVSAGMGNHEAFNVSRQDVVEARLNKAYIEAVVYELTATIASLADLKQTVLRQAWARHVALKEALANAGIPLTPLMLVQVENGKNSIEEAQQDLIRLCKVPPAAIGSHSSDNPDPSLMESIAKDPTKEVLIFKESAGTGFDAPRAFVLATTKPVTSRDYAMQFIGRVMRVAREVRAAYDDFRQIPAELNTAYVYLAHAEAQKGFQAAVQVIEAVKSELEGQVERMHLYKTRSGATAMTTKRTSQPELTHTWGPDLPDTTSGHSQSGDSADSDFGLRQTSDSGQGSLFGPGETELDTVVWASAAKQPNPASATSYEEWESHMRSRDVMLYPIRREMVSLPRCLKRENKPDAINMAQMAERIATQVELDPSHLRNAILAARDRLTGKERRTELTTLTEAGSSNVHIILDRNRVTRDAMNAMMGLPQFEPADCKIMIETMAGRITPRFKEKLEDADVTVSDDEFRRMTRTAACWLIKSHINLIVEALHAEVAQLALTVDAEPLPDVMPFPTSIALEMSRRNIYGVLPPSKEDLDSLDGIFTIEDQQLLRDQQWFFGPDGQGGSVRTGRFDNTFSLNPDEKRFAEALDRSEFVAWWFRNPEKKPYSVRLVRGEHQNFFYPDFVVCLAHVDGAEPVQRLVETKHDLKDAQRKSRHTPEYYGKVLFLTQDAGDYRIVEPNGTLGSALNMDDLETLREALQKTAP